MGGLKRKKERKKERKILCSATTTRRANYFYIQSNHHRTLFQERKAAAPDAGSTLSDVMFAEAIIGLSTFLRATTSLSSTAGAKGDIDIVKVCAGLEEKKMEFLNAFEF